MQAELVQSTQLPDGLREVRLAHRADPVLFMLELATYSERRVASQAARDALVRLERGELPEVLGIVLCTKGNLVVADSLELERRNALTRNLV